MTNITTPPISIARFRDAVNRAAYLTGASGRGLASIDPIKLEETHRDLLEGVAWLDEVIARRAARLAAGLRATEGEPA